MPPDADQNHARKIQDMFSRIAPRYDLVNHLTTGWQDIRWRRFVIQQAQLPTNGLLLDLGVGTGELAHQVRQRHPQIHAIGADLTLEMMHEGRKKFQDGVITWTAANALQLPFSDRSFDAVVSSFLLRNVSDLERCLRESYRVLKPGGTFVALETTPSSPHLLSPLIKFHMQTVIPTLGKWIAGDKGAYHYLHESTGQFVRPERLLAYLAAFGFKKLQFKRMMLGTIAVHWSVK